MPARFCPQCGTAAAPNAKFCIECGTSLAGDTRAAAGGGWQITSAGLGVLGFFVVGGLGIWAAVLSPATPTPGPGRAAARPAATAPAPVADPDLPPDHPKVAMQIPAEVKTVIDDLAKKADAWPAYYYLGVGFEQQGDRAGALAAVRKARELATEDTVRAQIDETIARMGGGAPAGETAAVRTPFQAEVEKAFRGHQIMGP